MSSNKTKRKMINKCLDLHIIYFEIQNSFKIKKPLIIQLNKRKNKETTVTYTPFLFNRLRL